MSMMMKMKDGRLDFPAFDYQHHIRGFLSHKYCATLFFGLAEKQL